MVLYSFLNSKILQSVDSMVISPEITRISPSDFFSTYDMHAHDAIGHYLSINNPVMC